MVAYEPVMKKLRPLVYLSQKVIKWALVILVSLILALLLFISALQTDYVRKHLIDMVNKITLTNSGISLEVGPVKGIIPFRFEAGEIALHDSSGRWLTMEDFYIKIALMDMLRGRFVINRLCIKNILVQRSPEIKKKKEGQQPEGLKIPTIVSRITVKDIEAPLITLDHRVIGRAACFRFRGGISNPDNKEKSEIRLEVEGLEGFSGSFKLFLSLDDTLRYMTFKVSADDPGKGILYHATGFGQGLKFDLEGRGELSDLNGKLHVSGKDIGTVSSDINVRYLGDMHISLSGNYLPKGAPWIEKYTASPDMRADFRVDAGINRNREIHLDYLQVKSGENEAMFKGEINLSYLDSEGNFNISINDPLFLSNVLKGYTLNRLSANGCIKGRLYSPDIDLSLNAKGPGNEKLSISEVSGNAFVRFPERGRDERRVNLSGNGQARGLNFENQDMGSGDLAFNMDADLGAAKISGTIRGSFMPGQKIQDMVKAPVDNFNFEGKLSYSDNSIGLSDVIIDGNGLTFKAAGTYKPDGALDSRCRIMLPDLGLFSRYTGKEVMGAADMDCSVKGGRDMLELSSRVEVRDLLFDRVRADAVKAQVTLVKSSTDYSGKISGEFINGINSTEAELDIRLSGSDLFISGLRAAGFNTELTGNMRLDLGMTLMDGSIAFSSPDVSDLSLIFGQDIRGALSGNLKLQSDQGLQNGELFLSADNLLLSQGEAEGISVSGTVSDLFNRAVYRAEAEVHGFKRDGLILDKVSISGGGEKERREFHIKGDGKAGQELHFEAWAGLLNNEAGTEISIKGLKGIFGAVPFNLLTPLNIKYSSSDLRVENIDLELDSGSVRGGFSNTNEMIEGGLFIEKMPLQLLALIGGPLLDGEADASLSVGGSMLMPLASGEISITGVKQGQTKEGQTPDLLINADYSLDSKGVSLNFTADALLSGSLTGYIIYPVKFSVSPFMFVPVESDSLNGNIQGELDLASLAQVFNLHGQTFSGRVTMDFDIGGKYTFPIVSGSAVLSQGRYENTGIGLVLKNIAADVSADDSWFTINISADDGLKGTVRSNGRFDLDAQKGFSYEIGTILKNMKAASMEMLETVVSGDTVVNGSSEGDKISGRVIIENAEFNIPEKLPFEITELEVKEINKKDEEAAEKIKLMPETRDIKYDLAISSSGRVFIRGRGLESEWKGRLKLEGGAGEPLITGELSLIKGDYNFLSKPFILTKGNILFSGNSPPDPYFDVTGEIQSSDITAFISIKGNIRNPALNLYSEPVMAQDEILSRILFGRSVSQITPMQAIQLAAALNEMVRGGSGFDPVRFTRNLIGVDRLEIKQSQTGNGGTAVSAGKYLKDNVYIEVERGVSTESGKASITWELTPNFTVGTEMGEDARKGMELNWKYDYR